MRTAAGLLILALVLTGANGCSEDLPGPTGAVPPELEACTMVTVGVDTAAADGFTEIGRLGFAVGETFYAPTTSLRSITVWRAPAPVGVTTSVRVFVAGLDDAGAPDMTRLLSDGPTVSAISIDATRPTPFVFEFDPPIELPAAGTYYFALTNIPARGATVLLASRTADYAEGILYDHGRFNGSVPRLSPTPYPGADLVFTAALCHPEK